jgi:hypothetical protein
MNNTEYPNWLYNENHVFHNIYYCIIGIFLFLPLIMIYWKGYKKYSQSINSTNQYCAAILISIIVFVFYIFILAIIGNNSTSYGSNINPIQGIGNYILPIAYAVGITLFPIALFSGLLTIIVLIINVFRQKNSQKR